ncbi:DUF2147 domain-containing protein [Flagellimonas baculiformis]|uniref:DUF2147 domain-containing protein n=1 Tax=Flagellimonas baculiformis TaxID=3067310 RepID=UPI00296F7A8E|nr:DUF2147 domain-containing protein [Muricauda sp. D6]
MDKTSSRCRGLNTGLFTTIIAGLLLLSFNVSAQITETAIVGTWLNQEKAAKIEIYQKGQKFYGKIVWLKEPNENGKPKTDNKNPDTARRNDPIMGLVLLKDLEFDGSSTWENGTIYDARNGKTYSCHVTFQEDRSLKVRGYVGISLFGKTTIWTRTH